MRERNCAKSTVLQAVRRAVEFQYLPNEFIAASMQPGL